MHSTGVEESSARVVPGGPVIAVSTLPVCTAIATPDLVAAIKAATVGASFSIPLDAEGTRAILTLTAVQKAGAAGGMSPIQDDSRLLPALKFISELHLIMADRIKLGQARSPLHAANQLVSEGKYRGYGGNPENQAHYLASTYRNSLSSSAFSKHLQLQLQ